MRDNVASKDRESCEQSSRDFADQICFKPEDHRRDVGVAPPSRLDKKKFPSCLPQEIQSYGNLGQLSDPPYLRLDAWFGACFHQASYRVVQGWSANSLLLGTICEHLGLRPKEGHNTYVVEEEKELLFGPDQVRYSAIKTILHTEPEEESTSVASSSSDETDSRAQMNQNVPVYEMRKGKWMLCSNFEVHFVVIVTAIVLFAMSFGAVYFIWIIKAHPVLLPSATCQSYSRAFQRDLVGVCVCNATSCHTLPDLPPSTTSIRATMFTTSKAGKRFEPASLQINRDDGQGKSRSRSLRTFNTYHFDASIEVDSREQTVMGFGGAWTDAVAINLFKMDPKIQDQILEAYYGRSGLEYNMGRIPMASTDCSEYVYSYNDVAGDFDMTNFSIDADLPPKSNKIPMIKRILAMSSRNMTLFASPWAPPVWMTSQSTTVNCQMLGYPGGDQGMYWQAWGKYFSKFLTAYLEQGIPIAAVTVQNEPVHYSPVLTNLAHKRWQSLRINATTERDFIRYELGPTLRRDHPDVMIILMDDQKPTLAFFTQPTMEDPVARDYVSGIGFHWYLNVEFVTPFRGGDFQELTRHHDRYPDIFLLATEACEGAFPRFIGTGNGVRITEPHIIWQRAENYARDIIGDLQNHAVGWVDWNVLLDLRGGPSWAHNYVDAPVLVDTVGGQEWYKQPMYYIMAHFSKYISPGSVRLRAQEERKDSWVEMVSFLTKDGNVVVVFQNRRSLFSRRFRVRLAGGLWVEGTLDRDSVSTLVIPLMHLSVHRDQR